MHPLSSCLSDKRDCRHGVHMVLLVQISLPLLCFPGWVDDSAEEASRWKAQPSGAVSCAWECSTQEIQSRPFKRLHLSFCSWSRRPYDTYFSSPQVVSVDRRAVLERIHSESWRIPATCPPLPLLQVPTWPFPLHGNTVPSFLHSPSSRSLPLSPPQDHFRLLWRLLRLYLDKLLAIHP